MATGRRQRTRRESKDVRDEFEQVIVDLARVTRVMAGGKRMRFRACVAIGDKKGRLGIGIAKGADVQLAISKAVNDAKKNVVKVKITDSGTIPHEVRVKSHSAHILMKPAPRGTGIIAGSVVRQIFELSGISDVVGKIIGTDNNVNNAKAVIEALNLLRKPRQENKVDKKGEKPKEVQSAEKSTVEAKAEKGSPKDAKDGKAGK